MDNTAKSGLTMLPHISALIRQDLGCRGFSGIVSSDDLQPAAMSLMTSERVLIVTGFCVLDKMIGETDGPPGALILACALTGLGKQVRIITDRYSSALVEAGMSCYPLGYDMTVVPVDQQKADKSLLDILEAFKPDHIVSIERPGQAADGNAYSMRGEQLNIAVPLMDVLFNAQNICTIAIGDGGNELGMGSAYDLIKNHVPLGEKIGCITKADLLIPAGVSNWAGYGLAAALSFLSGTRLLPDEGTEVCVLEAMVKAGAVDGCTKRNELSVDGVPFAQYLEIINQIYQLLEPSV